MKKIILLLCLSFFVNCVLILVFAYKIHNNWFATTVFKLPLRTSIFNEAPKKPGLIYFVGDSHTEGFELNEFLENKDVRNRGVWGDMTETMLPRVKQIAFLKPKKVFIMIGVNDILSGKSLEKISDNLKKAIAEIRTTSPDTKVFVESILPTSNIITHSSNPALQTIISLNKLYEADAKTSGAGYIDLFPAFLVQSGLKHEFDSGDGLHLNGLGYRKWSEIIHPYL